MGKYPPPEEEENNNSKRGKFLFSRGVYVLAPPARGKNAILWGGHAKMIDANGHVEANSLITMPYTSSALRCATLQPKGTSKITNGGGIPYQKTTTPTIPLQTEMTEIAVYSV